MKWVKSDEELDKAQHEREAALKRGFKTYPEFAAYRCSLKRQLRKAGIEYNKESSTEELEGQVQAGCKLEPVVIDKVKYEDIPTDVEAR